MGTHRSQTVLIGSTGRPSIAHRAKTGHHEYRNPSSETVVTFVHQSSTRSLYRFRSLDPQVDCMRGTAHRATSSWDTASAPILLAVSHFRQWTASHTEWLDPLGRRKKRFGSHRATRWACGHCSD